jgi:hypothetical protein
VVTDLCEQLRAAACRAALLHHEPERRHAGDLPPATLDLIKAMPQFEYANDNARRNQFIATAEKDITRGKAKVFELEKKAGAATTEAKAKIDLQITALQVDVKSAEAKLSELNQAATTRWKEFEASVSAATARLRKSIDNAKG